MLVPWKALAVLYSALQNMCNAGMNAVLHHAAQAGNSAAIIRLAAYSCVSEHCRGMLHECSFWLVELMGSALQRGPLALRALPGSTWVRDLSNADVDGCCNIMCFGHDSIQLEYKLILVPLLHHSCLKVRSSLQSVFTARGLETWQTLSCNYIKVI
jgi:hypothetical protein